MREWFEKFLDFVASHIQLLQRGQILQPPNIRQQILRDIQLLQTPHILQPGQLLQPILPELQYLHPVMPRPLLRTPNLILRQSQPPETRQPHRRQLREFVGRQVQKLQIF